MDEKDVLLPKGPIENMHCVYEILSYAAEKYKNNTAYTQKNLQEQNESISFAELKMKVDALRSGLLNYGIAGNHVAIIGETCYEWIVTYLALISGCGVCVPIDKSLENKTMSFQLDFADVATVFISSPYVEKLSEIIKDCPKIKNIVILRGDKDAALNLKCNIITFDNLLQKGETTLNQAMISNPAETIDPDKNCVIMFTSGTTGPNKGVMLSNRSVMGTLRGCLRLHKYPSSSFSVLPINHAYELNAHLMLSLYCGTCVHINDNMLRFMNNIKECQPEMSCMVPMMLDLIVRKIKRSIIKSGMEQQFHNIINLSDDAEEKKKFLRKILEPLGGKLKFIISGGAALNQDTFDFLSSIGIIIYNGYGITECSPVVAVNSRNLVKPGSVGRLLPKAKARVVNIDKNGNGEIEIQGDLVMQGYYKNPEDTAKVITEDGWFKTGDIGYIDKDKYLYITGRLKNLIILPNGENVYPEQVEKDLMKCMNYIKECVVTESPNHNGLYAYIYPDFELIADETSDLDKIRDRIQTDINVLNNTLPAYKRIVDFKIRENEFEKNTTNKILRHKIIQ